VLNRAPIVARRYTADRAIEVLERAGLWRSIESGIESPAYLKYNPSKADVKEKRAENAKRQAEWRAREKASRNGVSNGVTNDRRNATPVPALAILLLQALL
jgi:hypothetical protein